MINVSHRHSQLQRRCVASLLEGNAVSDGKGSKPSAVLGINGTSDEGRSGLSLFIVSCRGAAPTIFFIQNRGVGELTTVIVDAVSIDDDFGMRKRNFSKRRRIVVAI
ncbi:hypothetical protein EVAR_11400_1 [Eumeta japonica]|uniref:Uncharacterized protein n=1 Tax=Eumeta variegata TaxID=151549 RepID=A0A4C1TKR6_EUMVA|nr:hypothetical protein EVAR_11400_1 [Eumeta japonica]